MSYLKSLSVIIIGPSISPREQSPNWITIAVNGLRGVNKVYNLTQNTGREQPVDVRLWNQYFRSFHFHPVYRWQQRQPSKRPSQCHLVSSNPAHGEIYSIQHYVLKIVSDLRGCSPVSSTNKTDRHDIPEILLKVALKTITLTPVPPIHYANHVTQQPINII